MREQSGDSPAGLLDRIAAAHERCAELHADPLQTAYRLFHGHGEGIPGLHIDRLGDVIVITHRDEHADLLDAIVEGLASRGVPTSTVVARSRRGGGPPRLVRGEAPTQPTVVRDGGLRVEVDPLSPGNAGLYLDARPARGWLRTNAAGRRVLNLFAYTGSLGLAAAAGGAKWVEHVEMQKRALRRLKHNHVLNGLPIDDRNLIRADLYPHLRRLARQGKAFDGIILDPPPQVPGRGTRGQDYETLVPLAVEVLAPEGWLLCFFSSYERTRSAYEQEVLDASPCPLKVNWRGTSGIDFPEENPESKLRFSAFLRPRALQSPKR